MKKTLLLLLAFLFAVSFKTYASHAIGGELSYSCIAPGTYQVTYKYFRDCAGASANLTESLQIKSAGCNAGRVVSLQKVSSTIAQPYGPQIVAACNITSPYPTYEIVTYSGMLTFTAAEMACPDWILSTDNVSRATYENMAVQNTNMYTEAYLKLGNNLVNSSPVFDTMVEHIPFVTVNQLVNTTVAATDPDGDSLSYKLVQPLSAAGVVVPYNLVFAASQIFVNPNPPAPYCNTCNPSNPQIGVFTPGVGFMGYSISYPLPSYTADWNAINPATGIPYQIVAVNPFFDLDPYNGDLTFQPKIFHDSTSWGQGRNKYLVSFRVDEFRKINGVVTKIGSVRRETMVVITDSSSNGTPFISNINITPNNQAVLDTIIRLRAGVPFTMQFTGTDPDVSNLVSLFTNAATVLPGATFTKTSGFLPIGTINWTPNAGQVRNRPYYFNILVKDDANPVRATTVYTVALQVSNTGGIAGLSSATADWVLKFTQTLFQKQ